MACRPSGSGHCLLSEGISFCPTFHQPGQRPQALLLPPGQPSSLLLSGLGFHWSRCQEHYCPRSSPGRLHLVIQVCHKPFRVPPNSFSAFLANTAWVLFKGNGLSLPWPPGVNLDLSNPIMVSQDIEMGLFYSLGLLARLKSRTTVDKKQLAYVVKRAPDILSGLT